MDVDAVLEDARARSDELTFVGGEPTLDKPGLLEAVSKARGKGFARVGIQSNGSGLTERSVVERLQQGGLTDLHLSVLGADAAVHDYHTGREGSFLELLAALDVARQCALPVAVTTVLTRSNFRVLAKIPPLLASRGVVAWLVSVPHIAGRAARQLDRIVPRLGLAVPFALHAMAAAASLRLPAWITGAPLCLLGPYASRALPTEARAYAAVCEACAVKEHCPGVDAAYLARFDGDELTVRSDMPLREVSDVTRLFVGAGELAAEAAPAAPSVAKARRALPMLGKVKPAVAEASRETERKTGEALKEIFPTLFEEPKG